MSLDTVLVSLHINKTDLWRKALQWGYFWTQSNPHATCSTTSVFLNQLYNTAKCGCVVQHKLFQNCYFFKLFSKFNCLKKFNYLKSIKLKTVPRLLTISPPDIVLNFAVNHKSLIIQDFPEYYCCMPSGKSDFKNVNTSRYCGKWYLYNVAL